MIITLLSLPGHSWLVGRPLHMYFTLLVFSMVLWVSLDWFVVCRCCMTIHSLEFRFAWTIHTYLMYLLGHSNKKPLFLLRRRNVVEGAGKPLTHKIADDGGGWPPNYGQPVSVF